MKRIFVIGVLAMLFCGVGFVSAQDSTAGYSEVSAIDMEFRWKVEDESLRCVLRAPTSGWISVGFDPSRRMRDANIIIGYVKNGNAEVFDHYGVTPISHRDDSDKGGSYDITDISGKTVNGGTELRFTIPLNSKDKYDKVLEVGKEYEIILAYSRSTSLRAPHSARTTVEITL